jgi:hypothetical protein
MNKRYQHYKGSLYELLHIAIHSETDEKLVIYKDEHDKVFARPYHMFFEDIEVNGELIPRFKEIK